MPAPPNRRPDDDPGFEEVTDPPPRPKKPAPPPARPATPIRPVAARPAPKKIVAEDPGFEVVDSPPPRPKKPKVSVVDDDPPPRPKKPKVQVVDDDTEEEPRAKAKTKRSRRLEEDDDESDREVGGRVDDRDPSQFNDLKMGKKKLTQADKRRVKKMIEREAREERAKTAEEWLFPSIVGGIGILLSMAGAGIIGSQNAFVGIAVVVMLIVTLVECILMIPFAVGALMLVGKLCGIEYGTLTHTIRSLGAIVAIDTGLYWMAVALMKFAPCVVWPVFAVLGLIATYGLFMKFFELDAMEARISIGAINFVTGAGTFLGMLFAVAIVGLLVSSARQGRNADPDDDDDPPVMQKQWKQPGNGKWQPPDDDPGDDNG